MSERRRPGGDGDRDRDSDLEAVPSVSTATVATKAAVLRRLELLVTRRLDGIVSGEFLGLNSGPGTEPASVRPYAPGDEARRIDWNVTARSLAPQIRTTDADRELETWLVVDRSASLDFGTTQQEKRDVVLAAMAAFGFLSLQGGNRVQVIVAGGDELVRFRPAGSRPSMLAALSRVHDTPRRDRAPAPEGSLTAALESLARLRRRPGRVVVISDFLDDAWATPLRTLSFRHQVVAVQVIDPREEAIPAVGILTLIDTETGRQLNVQTNSAKLRARYADAAAQRKAAIASSLRGAGADHLVLRTDGDWVADIAAFVRRGRLRAGGRVPASRAVAGGGRRS
jgi:uncharacterized protein (DUF58 family)